MAGLTELNASTFKEAISNASNPLVIDFWAPWCGPCKAIGPILEEIAEELGDKAQICKVNIDDNRDLAVELGIQSIPTLYFYKDGEKKAEKVGLVSKAELITTIQSL
ncbi:MAG: thioredoxin [Opitutae bacterium]|jgi:thioredoxin 1|nr:thioredoxin [Opitutae bacterium]MBT4224675.1 thioredoxin [Opitutae bacterium]MBT5378735.1 thioredoxin [Opitutae bacterium]MBT5692442.1 thioredoxin [Opitutae bacterium]MBT6463261.1 thioredoxin [Opitutae bacterium]